MNSILRKVMLPGAVAVAMAGFIGAFGGSAPVAHAIDGDICRIDTSASAAPAAGQFEEVVDYVVNPGETHGLVFRVEDSDNDHDNIEVVIDSETGSARITSQAEWLRGDEDEAEIGHVLVQPSTGSQVVDTIDPDDFLDSDGNELGGSNDDTGVSSINNWLQDVGYDAFVGDDDDSVCGNSATDGQADGEDSWGFIDFECIEAGYFHIDVRSAQDTEEIGRTVKFYCYGQAESAEISVNPSVVETDPVGTSTDSSNVTVSVEDQFGDRLDGAEVTFSTDNCRFDGDDEVSPAGGGTTVTTHTDTDTNADDNFLANNPLQNSAGTAEVVLNCSNGDEGVANITAIVQREGSDIVLEAEVNVVGQASATGLNLTLTPDDLECGETILAVATAVDALGQPVSDGTGIYFTTDTSSGVQGGEEGAQGAVQTVDGEASALIATDPGNPGTHTVIAYTINSAGTVNAQTSQTYVCDSDEAPVAPTVAPPDTGTGSITPPNTGNAGLAAGTSSSTSVFVLAGAVALALAGIASVRFARN